MYADIVNLDNKIWNPYEKVYQARLFFSYRELRDVIKSNVIAKHRDETEKFPGLELHCRVRVWVLKKKIFVLNLKIGRRISSLNS